MPEISEIVTVNITVASAGLTRQGFNSLLAVGDETNFAVGFAEFEVRKYTTFAALSADTDILDGDIKNMAQVSFGQIVAVPSFYVSRIDIGGSVAQVGTLVFTGDLITGNSIAITLDGVAIAGSPVAFNVNNSDTLDDIATAIQADARVVTAVGDGSDTVTVTSATAGRSLAVAAVVSGGASQVTAAFTITTPALADVKTADLSTIFGNNSDWFGFAMTYKDVGSIQTASAFLAANGRYGFFRQVSRTDFFPLNTNFSSLFNTDSVGAIGQWIEVGEASWALAQIPGTYTDALHTLELVDQALAITSSEETLLRANNVNQYSNLAGVGTTWNGSAANGGFIDTYIGVLYLKARIEEDVLAQLLAANKIPFTNAGVNLIVGACQARLEQSVLEGFLTNDPTPVTTAPLVADISATDKSNRLLPNVQFQAVTAGAIHTVTINGTIVA